MSRTSLNLKDNAHKPAPKWYRKLNRIISLVSGPVVVGLLDVFNASESTTAQVSQVILFLPTLLEIFNIALANGEDYTQRKNFNLNKVNVIILVAGSLLLLSSCSLEKKLNKAEHLLEDHGRIVLADSSKLPILCNQLYPCVTIESETTEKTDVKVDTTNDEVKKRLRELTDSIEASKKKKVDVTNPDSCRAAIEYYEAQLDYFKNQVRQLTSEIKSSTTTHTEKLQKQTVESTAKVKILENALSDASKDINRLVNVIAAKDTELALLKQQVKQYQSDEKDILYILGLLWDWAKWYIIIAAALFGLWKFRKPLLKLL